MAATVTLSTTTLAANCSQSDSLITLASVSGIGPGTRLYVDRELMAVDRLTGISTQAIVRRGIEGTAATPHGTASSVTIGRGDQFYSTDPVGLAPGAIPVSPYINILTGVSWVPQGDEIGPGSGARTWQPITTTQTIGPLGVRTNVTSTPS